MSPAGAPPSREPARRRGRLAGALGAARLGALALLSAAACTAPQDAPLELWAAGREGAVVAQLMPEFEARHPGVRVRVQQLPWRGAHEKLLTAVVGESTPDIAPLGNTWIPEFAMIGALTPLDARVAASAVVDEGQYFQGAWETNRFEGALYGVPWYVDTRLLYYRADLLAEAGFDQPPETWAEWAHMMRTLQAGFDARGEKHRSALFHPLHEPELLLALALQEEDPLLRDGGRYGNFRSEGFRRALGFYASLFQSGLAPKAGPTAIGNLFDEFARGNLVFYVSGPWQIGEFSRRLPASLAGKWKTAPLPGRDGPGESLAFGSSLVVFAGSKKQGAAWALIEHLSRPEVQQRFYELTGDLPPRRDSWRGPALESGEHPLAFRAQLERVVPTPAVPEWERILSQLAIVGEHVARASMSVDEAAAELDRRADRILEKRRWMLDRAASGATRATRPARHARAAARAEGER